MIPTRSAVVLRVFLSLCLLSTGLALSSLSSADCIGPPQLFVGESATYRFTDVDSESVDVTVRVLAEERYWQVLDVNEGGEHYRAVVETSCFDTGLPADYSPPPYPSFDSKPRLVELLRPSASPLSISEHLNSSDSNSCIGSTAEFVEVLGRSMPVNRCELAVLDGIPVYGVIAVDLTRIIGFVSQPLSGLLSKTTTFQNNRTSTVELVRIGDVIPDDGRPMPPRLLNSFSFGGNSIELTWQRPLDERAVLFEVQRNGEVIATVDALSYYDADISVFENYRYTVTAIDADGNRSVSVNIAPGFYNFGILGEFTPPERPVLPPQNFFGFILSGTSVELQWHPPGFVVENIFEISRDGAVLVATGGSRYVDNTVLPGNTYEYSIVTIGADGRRSSPLFASFTTPRAPGSGPPVESAPIFNVQSNVYSASAAELSWPDIFVGIGRRVEVYQNGSLIADFDGGSYFINNLQGGTDYEFEVFFYDYDGSVRGKSQLITFTTPGGAIDVSEPQPNTDIDTTSPLVVSENTISWPDDGWYQVQHADTFVTVCEGGQRCIAEPGSYIVINHSTGMRYENVLVEAATSVELQDDAIAVDGNTISWPGNGWYQVQRASDYESICEGGSSCTVEPGTYVVINHSLSERFENIVVAQPVYESPGSVDGILVTGATIAWPDDGWYQVQSLPDLITICEGGTFCVVSPGQYIVINHSSGQRWERIVVPNNGENVTGDDDLDGCEGTLGTDSNSANDDWGDNCYLQRDGIHAESSYTRGVQRLLNCLGYPLTVDAYFGEATEAAIMAFQSDNPPLPVHGIVDANTWRSLRNTLGTFPFDLDLDAAVVEFYDPDGDGVDNSRCQGDILFYQFVDRANLGGWTMAEEVGSANRVLFSTGQD